MSSLLRIYDRILLQNLPQINSIESTLRSLTYILPGRFQDAELASESLYSLLNLISIYHDSVLLHSISTLPSPIRPSLSSHTRYTNHYQQSSKRYAYLARSLTILTSLELVLEMSIKKRLGQVKAERAVLILEVLKSVIRLLLLVETKGRSLISPPIPEREVDPTLLSRYDLTSTSSSAVILPELHDPAAVVEATHPNYWKGLKTGYSRPTIASLQPTPLDPNLNPVVVEAIGGKDIVHQYLLTKVLTVEDVTRPEDLVTKLNRLGQLAEVIWILRPVLYAFALQKYGRRHTFPFALSLALEYLSYTLRKSTLAAQASDSILTTPVSQVESAETTKRSKAFWKYLLRGPMWENVTKPRIVAFADAFEEKPLIGFVSTLAKGYLPLVDAYHFYTN